MADMTPLRSNASAANTVAQNPTVGASKPPQINTGGLPGVQVKAMPAGPQIRDGQQKPVAILPGKDPKGAVATGGLPTIHVKNVQGGPSQVDDGRDTPVVIKDQKPMTETGHLPMVEVKLTDGGAEVRNVPQQQTMPPRLAGAAPVLSAPRNGQRVVRVGAPRVALPAAPQVPAFPSLSAEQLMLCRHLVDKYAGELRSTESPADETAASSIADNLKLADETLAAIDEAMDAIAARAAQPAEEAALVAGVAEPAAEAPAPALAPVPRAVGYVAPRPGTGGHYTPAGVSTVRTAPNLAPATRPAAVHMASGSVRTQGNASMAPRRVAKAGRAAPVTPSAPLPPVIVKMDNGRPAIQNQAEVAAAREAFAAELAATGSPEAAGAAARRAAPSVPLPPVIVKMDGGRPTVQNQAEVAAAKAAFEAELAAAVPDATNIGEPE